MKAARNLILTEDFALMSQLLRHARSAIETYSYPDLAVMVSSKRLTDFKRALSLRNVLSMDSPDTYGWILYQMRKNNHAIDRIPSYDELFAKDALRNLSAIAAQ